MNFYVLENEELKAVLSNDEIGEQTPIITANVSEKLTSYDILTLEIPADNTDIKYLKENNTIVYEDIKGYREYIINEVEDVDNVSITRTVTGELSSIELIDEIVQTELNGSSNSPATILTSALNGTRWTVGSIDSAIYNSTFKEETKYKSVLEVLDLISSQFNCEVQFSYVVDRGQVVKRQVNLYKQFGENNGKRFEMDKDVSSIKRTIDSGNVKTAIIPFGKIKDAKDDALVDIKDLVWSKANGDPVDKPKGQNYIGHPDALAQWGRLNANGTKRHRFITVEMEVDSVAQLASMSWVQLGNYINPKITYESSVVDLYALNNQAEEFKHEHVNLGDTVVVIDNYFTVPIVVQSRIVEMERNLLDPTDKKIVFGDSLEQFSIGSVSDSVENIKNKLDEVEKNTNAVTESANGKNTNNYGSDIPTNNITGDLWYRPHPSIPNETQMLIWDGTQWVLELDTSDLTAVTKEVEAVITQADADRLKAEADFESAKVEAKEYADTKASEFDTELAIVEADTLKAKTDANNAVESANTANAKAEQAIEDAGFAKADSGTAILTANQAKASATTATEKALKAVTDSGTAITDAGTALTNANKAIADNKITDGKVVAVTSEVDTVKGQLSTKVESSVVNALTGTVSNLDTKVSQNASELTSKATKTEVNTISGKVDSNSTKITQNSTAITAKADKSVVDTLTQTVNTTKAEVAILPNKIDLAVSESKTYTDSLTQGSSVVNKTEILSGNPVFTDKSDDAVVHVGVDGLSVQKLNPNARNMVHTNYTEWEGGHYSLQTGNKEVYATRIRMPYLIKVNPNTTYYWNTFGIYSFLIRTYKSDGTFLGSWGNVGTTGTRTTSPEEFYLGVTLYESSEGKSSEGIKSDMQSDLLKPLFQLNGVTNKSFEEFVPSSPSPDYPIAINSLDKSFDIVSSVGKENVIRNSSWKDNTYHWSIGEWQWTPNTTHMNNNSMKISIAGLTTDAWKAMRSNIIPCNEGEEFTGSIYYRLYADHGIDRGAGLEVEWFDVYGGRIGTNAIGIPFTAEYHAKWNRVAVTGVAPKGAVGVALRVHPTRNGTFWVSSPKLERGSSVTPWNEHPIDIEYNTQSPTIYKTNILLSEPLRSVGDVKDRLFLDTDGLWKVERNVEGLIFNGTENWTVTGNSTAEKWSFEISSLSFAMKLGKGNYSDGISSHFIVGKTGSPPIETFKVQYSSPHGYIAFQVSKSQFLDVTAFKKWLTVNPVSLIYELREPYIETLSAEQQAYLNNIQSFKGSNYVYTMANVVPNLRARFKSNAWYRNFTFGADISNLSGRVTTNESSLTVQSNQIASKVAKTDFDILAGKQSATQSELTQTAGSLTSKITNVETDVAKRATKVEFSTLEQTVNGISTTVGNQTGQISTIQQTANGLQTTVASKADKTQITQLSGQIATKVESATYNSKMTQLDSSITSKVSATDYNTQITQLTTDINLRATKSGIMSQLNLNPEGILLQGKNIILDGNVTMATAFVTNIKAKSLEAIYADIATLKTKVLTTDVITSTMLKSDTAVIDKLFATDANVQRLTAKTAFINSVKAVDISADRLTTGTLNASNVSVINLDASRITSGSIKGITITSPFDYVYTGTTRNVGTTTIANGEYSSRGVFTGSFGSTYMKINPDGIYGDNLTSSGATRSLFKLNGDGVTVVKGGDTAYYRQDGVFFESGGRASISYYSGNARIEVGSYNGVSLGANHSGTFLNRLSVGGGQEGLVPFVDIYTKLNMRNNPIENVASIYTRFIRLTNQDSTISGSKVGNTNDNWLEMGGKWGTRIGHLGDDGSTIYTRITVPASGSVEFHTTLNMNGNGILNQSDIRLKKNIVDSELDGIALTKKQRFINFEWDESNPYNKTKPEGINFGLEAQYAGFMAVKDVKSNYLFIDMNAQVNLNTLTNQQLIKKLEELEIEVKQLKGEI